MFLFFHISEFDSSLKGNIGGYEKGADKTLHVANQMSMSYFLKCPLVCQQSPSKSLFSKETL